MSEPQIQNKLPENAYRELKPGESYVPMVPPGVTVPEVTTRSIIFGLIMNLIFAMAATYLALKVGQGIETAIPISILAVGLSGFLITLGRRRSSLIENVNILAIGTTSGIVAGGTVFTMPAIYMLKLNTTLNMSPYMLFLQIFLVPFLGAVLGVLFLVPFRRYFVKEMHGKLPFPEGTATNEILVSGSSGGAAQAATLIFAFVIGFAYNCVSGVLKLFTETFTTAVVPAMDTLTVKLKAVFSLGTGAEFLGLGFIIGVRYASIILAGSFLSWFVVIPLLSPLNLDQLQLLNPAAGAHSGPLEADAKFIIADPALREKFSRFQKLDETYGKDPEGRKAFLTGFRDALRPVFAANGQPFRTSDFDIAAKDENWQIKDECQTYVVKARTDRGDLAVFRKTTDAEDVFKPIPRNMGIGCIFTAGLLSILKMSKVIVTALRQALGSLFRRRGTAVTLDRTDQDISYPMLMFVGLLTAIAIWVYFRFVALNGMPDATRLSVIALALSLVVAFIFTTVSAWAIATISVTPISGMTVTTIIITAVALMAAGLSKGPSGQLAVLLVGGVVASCLSMAGTLITEMKISYWTGATPSKVQWSAIFASLLASAAVTATVMVLAKAPGFDPDVTKEALRAPQAAMMKGALESFLGTGQVPWLVYGTGVVIAFLVNMVGISPLAFGLGMYLPMELNAPILVGAITAALVNKSSKHEATRKARNDKGVLIASGLIAGAAILGVCKSIASIASPDLLKKLDFSGTLGTGAPADILSNWIGVAAFLGMCVFVYSFSATARAPRPELEGRA